MMSSLKTYSFLLLIFPLVIVCSPVTSARRVPKGGCLNYGHSCLGAHGKRASPPAISPSMLSILLEALSSNPAELAVLSHASGDAGVGTDTLHRAVRYPSRKIVSAPAAQEDEDAMARAIMPDVLRNLLASQLNGRDVRARDGVDERSEADVVYPVNMEDYADDRIRRSAVGKVPVSKGGQKETGDEWEQEKEGGSNRREQNNNRNLRYETWLRR